jgi:hypothetical protein
MAKPIQNYTINKIGIGWFSRTNKQKNVVFRKQSSDFYNSGQSLYGYIEALQQYFFFGASLFDSWDFLYKIVTKSFGL